MAESFSLIIPPSWFELELRPARRDDVIKDLVNERVGSIPELREHRGEITRILRKYAKSAWDSGARYATGFAIPTDELTITGCVTVTNLPFPQKGEDDPVASIAERLSTIAPEPGEETFTSVTIVELDGIGPCARTFGIEDVHAPDGRGWIRTVTMQTFVPTPEGNLLLVSAASPDIDLSEDLLELFDTVTSTLTVIHLDETDEVLA